ncbi:MAG: alpha-L-rhamnosidase C-terminal domain-containing protein, partial [Chitinophagaceae bacterium]
METYMDCPYYEQLQYAGDTRIQALISLYNSGDDKLMRNAIRQLDQSRMAEGITLSRYPTRNSQQIPPFALWWIGMLHDYWKYRPDTNFVREHLAGMRQVLWFFSKYQEQDGSLKGTPYWNFTDWCESPGWNAGVAPIGGNGHSAAMDFQLLWAFQLASEIENKLGSLAKSKEYKEASILLKSSIRKRYFSPGVQLFADTEEKNVFSQHVNTLAILTNTTTLKETEQIAQNILTNKSLAQATIYFKYYVHQALVKANLGNQYLEWLEIWKENLQMGMTTWAEISDINAARSDCHAWGSSPNIEFFRTILGIDSDAPGFRSVRIEPRPGKLAKLKGTMPHPAGLISVDYRIVGK